MDIDIDIRIPYDCSGERNLGRAYNVAMASSPYNNVCLVDHDVYLPLNPHYMQIMQHAVRTLQGKRWGWITCYTNRIGCWWQKITDEDGYDVDSIDFHKAVATDFHNTYQNELQEVSPVKLQEKSDKKNSLPSGFLILTNKEAWAAAGGFEDGFQGIDNKYALALDKAGYTFHLMRDLYVYHNYSRERP